MLQVFYSNYLERLVEGLVTAVDAQRRHRQGSLLVRTPVVVGSGHLQTYLKFETAKQRGIAAHLDYMGMEQFFGSLLPDGVELLSSRALQHLLLEALYDTELLAGAQMQPIRRYLEAASDDPDARELRRFQLSNHLASLFREYDYTRPAMIAGWPDGPLFDQRRWGRIERWQRALWLDLFGPGGRLERLSADGDTRHVRLPALFDTLDPGELELPQAVHIFAPGHVGKSFEGLLGELGRRTDVSVWALNPCREFWEDVVTDIHEEADLLSSRAVDGGQLTLAGEQTFWEPETFPPALRLWGRTGRDQVRMLDRLCGHAAGALYVDPTEQAHSTLRRLQSDILNLADEREEPVDGLDDDTIQFLACAGVQREAEAIADEVWALMRGQRQLAGDEPLRFNDIAVIVNREQRAAYQTHLQAAFRDVYDIPVNVIDLQAASASRVIEAVELLVDLPFGDFKRRELLGLLTHPNVVAKFPDVDPDQWLEWCDELDILHGADHADHDDTYIHEDLYNWDQGLKRLVLGGFMSGETSGERRAFRHGRFDYLPHEYPHEELSSAAQLVMCARSLIDHAKSMRRSRRTLAQWCERIASSLEAHLEPTDDAEEFELMRVGGLLSELADTDLSGRRVSYRIAREFICQALGTLEGGRGQYLADGVVVSSFVPMRPMPFRVVFVAGMGEAYFPFSEGSDPLDLRLAKWQEGDARRRDHDKYAFLQTLMSTRERLYVSYVSRDGQTGEPLEPSSVVRDLQHILEQGYLGADKAAECVVRHPLRRYDRAYFDESSALGPTLHPEARREAAALKLCESLEAHCREHGVSFPEIALLDEALDEGGWRTVSRVLGTYQKPAPAAPDEEAEEVSVSLSQLRRFLETPLQTSARWILGLRGDDTEDLLEAEDEVFESSYTRSLQLARDVFLQTAREEPLGFRPPFWPAYDEQARYLELRGELPTGTFGEGERKKHMELLETWRDNLQVLGVDVDRPLTLKRFGRAERHAPVDEIWDSLGFDVTIPGDGAHAPHRMRVELFGEAEALDDRLATSVTLVSRSSAKDKDFLRGFITHMAMVAAGRVADTEPFDLVVVPSKPLANARSLAKYRKRLAPISRAEANAYLKAVLADFLSGVHAYLMPIEAAVDYRDPDNDKSFADLVEARLTSRWSTCSSQYGPVRDLHRFGVPDDPDALIARRLGAFLDRLSEG